MSAKVLLMSFNLSFIKVASVLVEPVTTGVEESVVTVVSSLSITLKNINSLIFLKLGFNCYIRFFQFYYQVLQFCFFIIDHFYEVGH